MFTTDNQTQKLEILNSVHCAVYTGFIIVFLQVKAKICCATTVLNAVLKSLQPAYILSSLHFVQLSILLIKPKSLSNIDFRFDSAL